MVAAEEKEETDEPIAEAKVETESSRLLMWEGIIKHMLCFKQGKESLMDFLSRDPEILENFLLQGDAEHLRGLLAIPEFKSEFYDLYTDTSLDTNAFVVAMKAAAAAAHPGKTSNSWKMVREIINNAPDLTKWPINAILGDQWDERNRDLDSNESEGDDYSDVHSDGGEDSLTTEPTRSEVDRLVKKRALGYKTSQIFRKEKYIRASVSDKQHDTLLALAVKSRKPFNVQWVIKKFGPRLQERPLMRYYEDGFYIGPQKWDFSIRDICNEIKSDTMTTLIESHFDKK